MTKKITIGIVAPSSVLPKIEFQMGINKLKSSGFAVKAHQQCKKKHFFYAGTAHERAKAFFEMASDPKIDVLWCARGGYGANQLLPLLERLTDERGVPDVKLLVGLSDATVLHEFVRSKWGWSTLHAPMPAGWGFLQMNDQEWDSLVNYIQKKEFHPAWEKRKLKFFYNNFKKDLPPLKATLVGGNLSLWCSLAGTVHFPRLENHFLFLEEISESLSRIDRMVEQIYQAGGFSGVRAIILGDFLGCEDRVSRFWAKEPIKKNMKKILKKPEKAKLKPLRGSISQLKGLQEIFGCLGRDLEIPVAYGLSVGHGPGFSPLPLGINYQLDASGNLKVVGYFW